MTLLARLAVAKAYHGLGHGADLVYFALTTAAIASKSIASFGVITHPLDEPAATFYAHHGFDPLPADPQRAMIIRTTDLIKAGYGRTTS